MESLRINILNPKAEKLLKDLEELGLISINISENLSFKEILTSIRERSVEPPNLDHKNYGIFEYGLLKLK